MDWNAVNAIATTISMVAFILTALYVRAELKAMEKDRYLAITHQLFAIWETKDFMDAHFWLVHRLQETNWNDFVRAHRADVGEAAFHRVGSFYDRVGTLVRLGFVKKEEILPTIGPHAVAVWQKLQPLVYEARRIEHSMLFTDFERLLPSCLECYVPSLGSQTPGSTSGQAEEPLPSHVERITVPALEQRLRQGKPLTLLDVRPAAQVAREPRTLPGAVLMPAGEVEMRLDQLPMGQELVAYCA